MAELSEHQLDVLRKMQDGWELGLNTGFTPQAWLQQKGLGRGGETQKVKLNTLHGLEHRGLIQRVANIFPTQPFILTPTGIGAAEGEVIDG